MGAVGAAPDALPWGAWVAVVVGLALITTLGTVAVAIISRGARKHAADAAERTDAVLEQVKNSHTTNLREDVDGIGHTLTKVEAALAVLTAGQEALVEGQRSLGLSVGGLHEDVRILHKRDGLQSSEVAELRREIQRHAQACTAGDRDQLG